jgi:hypothetical protein
VSELDKQLLENTNISIIEVFTAAKIVGWDGMYEYIPNFRQIGSKVEMEKETYTMIS